MTKAPTHDFCAQCWRKRPIAQFVSRDGRRYVARCASCRRRYANWGAKEIAENALDVRALGTLVRANRGRRGFTFTHKPLTKKTERDAIVRANAAGFVINLSADGLEDADRLSELGIAPVVTVVPSSAPAGLRTPAGRKIVLCPAETHGLTCAECQLCAHPTRKSIVAFRAHGQSRAVVSDIVQLRRKTPAARAA